MKRAEFQDLLVPYILEELSAAEMSLMDAEIRESKESRRQYKEALESVDALYELAPIPPIDESRHQQLLSNVLDRCQAGTNLKLHSRSKEQSRANAWGGKLLALAAGFALAAFLGFLSNESNSETERIAGNESPMSKGEDLAANPPWMGEDWREQLRNSPIADAPRSTMLFVSLAPEDRGSDGRMFVLVDELSSQLHVYGLGFEAASAGTTYVLQARIEGETETRMVGTVEVASNGSFDGVFEAPSGKIREIFLDF